MSRVDYNAGPRGGRSFTVSNNQNIAAVYSSTDEYTAFSYVMQPGVESQFPWLAPIATNYETYRFTSLSVTYEGLVGTMVPGRIGMYFEYDVEEDLPATYQAATAKMGFTSCSPFSTTTSRLDIKRAYQQTGSKYVRPAPTLNRFNDTAKLVFVVLSEVGGAAALLGQLKMHYTVQFTTPTSTQASPNLGASSYETTIYKEYSANTNLHSMLFPDQAVSGGTLDLKPATAEKMVEVPPGQYTLSATTPLVNMQSASASASSHTGSLGFLYNVLDSLAGSTEDPCAYINRSKGPATNTWDNWMRNVQTFTCTVDLPVKTFIAPYLKQEAWTNVSNLFTDVGTFFNIERLGPSLAAVAGLLGDAKLGATAQSHLKKARVYNALLPAGPRPTILGAAVHDGDLPEPSYPTWPPIPDPWPPVPDPVPDPGPGPELKATSRGYTNQGVQPAIERRSRADEARPVALSFIARRRLLEAGHKEPFSEELLDTLPARDWVVVGTPIGSEVL
jgi:hypothetical protein